MHAHDPLDRSNANFQSSSQPSLDRLCGNDPAMLAMLARARLLIDRQLPILILGETGTGKEYLSRALHDYSARRQACMVSVNCGSIPESLIESELFGYQRGAFSGALNTGMKGKVVQADGGTLFLDEIGDMPFAQQTRLLRVLSEREVTPIGATAPVRVDLQLICATHQNLESRVQAGAFREDLYYRVAVGIVHLPPLRLRQDRAWLLDAMIATESRGNAGFDSLDDEARELLLSYAWPGNLRQMRAAVQYACAVKLGDTIRVSDLPANLVQSAMSGTDSHRANGAPPAPHVMAPAAGAAAVFPNAPAGHIQITPLASLSAIANGEREIIIRVLSSRRWNISAASRELGICRTSLYRKLRELHIPHVRDMGRDVLLGPER
ncbi:sigma-54-dependent Fis family transcriptional regulator [Pandoraea terrigena]|uniref:Sigma-54-dependent Fis family transcriptional regulator n=1 Tax=Pandoraea terrigena TaxID=2508292 RepID=A0A5E4ST70_9BURK|nr:sigma 54-interacting transcriptional regulator [Pandoraea terrigena]VVD77598.1 sigma-54-dependent Fis family transcriptional regulator [Pandoraea terrigena]